MDEGEAIEEEDEEEVEDTRHGMAVAREEAREAVYEEEEVKLMAQVGEHVPSSPVGGTRHKTVIEMMDTYPHQAQQQPGEEGIATSTPSNDPKTDRFLQELGKKLGGEGEVTGEQGGEGAEEQGRIEEEIIERKKGEREKRDEKEQEERERERKQETKVEEERRMREEEGGEGVKEEGNRKRTGKRL